MTFSEKSILCSDCGKSFAFTASEQEFFASKGFTNEPKRCPSCRMARRSESTGNNSGNYSNSAPRKMFPITCSQCKVESQVPFQPRGDRPVLCRDCYTKSR